MSYVQYNTVYALATGAIRSALAVIRVSGPQTSTVVRKIGKFKNLPEPRKAIYRKLYDPVYRDRLLDHGIILWFPGPKSYTGEDACEFHIHGGPAVIQSVLGSISHIPNCRMAEPGEFSKRAFLNGKMDLTEVDGLVDLISAETEMQRIQALNQISGSLGKLYESWRDKIAKCLANCECYIDFAEDENIEHDILETVEHEILSLIEELNIHLSDKRRGERLRSGVHITILGQPNVGKSSLLNILCKREAAIVSQIPGTTRDVIETTINLNGYPAILQDTAGIRSNSDVIESEGIRRAVMHALKSDLIILMIDPTTILTCASEETSQLNVDSIITNELLQLFSSCSETINLEDIREKILPVFNKTDLIQNGKLFKEIRLKNDLLITTAITKSRNTTQLQGSRNTPPKIIGISCKTNDGMNLFMEILGGRVKSLCADPNSECLYLTQERYRSHLENCVKHLQLYLNSTSRDLALKTHNLKNAMNSIGYITGHYGTEDILDILFKNFCIGK